MAKENAAADKLPLPDSQMEIATRGYKPPPSAWQTKEKAFYESLLTKGRFDVLVVPFQVQDSGALARDVRSLMTAQLALAVAEGAKVSVPDPYLVARALGDGDRRFDLASIFRIANAIGAKRIVTGYVGADGESSVRITMNAYQRLDGAIFSVEKFGPQPAKTISRLLPSERLMSRRFDKVAFSALSTPMDTFQGLLPDILNFLGIDATHLAASKRVSRFDTAALPNSPLGLSSDGLEPARDAFSLQLMAALTPEWADRERERLVEKSMLAVMRMSPESPDYRVLRARGLMYMGLRPAALQTLGTPATAEEKHVFAMLNGNLPAVQANVAQIPSGIRALTALVEMNAIETAYKATDKRRTMAALAALKLPSVSWRYLAKRALDDPDPWAQADNLELKALLDYELPVAGFTAENLVRGAATLGDMARARTAVDLSVEEHFHKMIERSPAEPCCHPLVAQFTQADFVDFVRGVATDNLSRRARLFVNIHANPDSALDFLGRIDGVYRDHPDFVLMRAVAQLQKAERASDAERETLAKAAYVDGYNVWNWEQGQTRASASAFNDAIGGARRRDFGSFHNAYVHEYPYQPFYPYWQYGGDVERTIAEAKGALDYACFDFSPVEYLESTQGQLKGDWAGFDEAMKQIDRRFEGNPVRVKLMAQASARKGDLQSAERYYAEGIKRQPAAQELYMGLGKALFESAAQEKAAAVFMSFPGLKKKSDHPVELSNYAYEAGSLYYWSGDFKRALPLYKVAADLNTGSGASIASATRIALLNGDYAGALRGSLEIGQRYSSPYGFRDYIGMLHALGFSKDAWQGFATLIVQLDEPPLWETALVGHRMEGASEEAIAAWAAQEPIRSAGRELGHASSYLLRAGVTDRMPSADLPARIAAVERPVWRIEDQYRQVVRPSADGSSERVLGPNTPERASLVIGLFANSKKTRVKSDLVYYAEAYTAIRQGKFDEARAALEEATTSYDTRNDSLGYLLPAYAYAAARSNNVTALEHRLDRVESKYQKFDYQLAKAIVAAVSGRHDEATQHLRLALVRRPFTEERPIFTEYQYAEVCEWLFETTRDNRYRNMAVDWAKKNQVLVPWFAWPYAVEARLSTNPEARERAIAMAHYLDPKSERLSTLPKAEISKAVKAYANRNPFRRAVQAAPSQPS